MKKTVLIFLFLFKILTIANSQEVVKVGAFNFYPGIFQDTDGVIKGFYLDALNELGEKENIEFVYVYGSWDEGLERMKNGEVDILTSVAITEERLNYMDYTSVPLLTVWSEVYVGQKSEINGILDLEGKTVAVMKSDFNGGYLKQLTKKLDVNCSFVETSDFEEVFKLISSKKVDAGVVNNTFGAPKSEEYGLLSSGIIFNPFDIFITLKKDSNPELLKLINEYLHLWKRDRNSVFNVARQKWSHGTIGAIEVFPKWLQKGIYSTLLLVLVLIVFIGLLRYKVRVATEKVKHSERLFRTFMENTPAYVYVKDDNLNHIFSNKMVNDISPTATANKTISAKTVFEPHIAELVEKTDQEILNSEKQQLNLQYQCKLNDKNIWLHDYKFYLQLPNGKPAIGGVSFDISKLKETEFELIKAKEQAQESDRLKSAFLANMSHEIRTPMNGILGFASLLKEPNLSGEKLQKYIGVIENSGARMLNVIDEIIDISKIESGTMEIDIKQTNIISQLDYVFTFFKPEVETKSIDLQLKNTLSAEEAIINTDSEKIYAILINLVKNAIKYTEKGSIEFGCDFIENQNSPFLQFFVKDTGVGIAKNRQKAIFERFIQADIKDIQARQGAGLGLSISKAYIEMLGGKIWVDSEEGIGSTFYFTIPYTSELKETVGLTIENTDEVMAHKIKDLKILIAEDDESSVQLVSIFVQKIAKEIIAVQTGTEAVEACRNNPDIDLILMDVQMSDMNGHDATQQIRKFNKNVIIIAQTAYALSGDRGKAISVGCNDYISKPINKNKLESLIQKHIKKS